MNRTLIRHVPVSYLHAAIKLRRHGGLPLSASEVLYYVPEQTLLCLCIKAMATVQSDIFKPTKFGGKYTTTLIPGALCSTHKK